MSDVYTTPDIMYRIRNKETGEIVVPGRSTTNGWYEDYKSAKNAITQQGGQPREAPVSMSTKSWNETLKRWTWTTRAEAGLPVYPDDKAYRDAVFEVVPYRVTEISLQEATGG